MIKRVIFAVMAAFAMVSCFNETGYDTTYVLRVYEQLESGGDYIALDGTKAYAFSGNTDDWEFLSYEDAAAGVITSVDSGEQRGPFAWSQSYNGSESNIFMQLDRQEVILVICDPATQIYAYSEYTVPVNYAEMVVDIVFRPWKTSSYTASTWTFMVPETEEEELTEEEDELTEEEDELTEEEDELTEEEDELTEEEDELTDEEEEENNTDTDTDTEQSETDQETDQETNQE